MAAREFSLRNPFIGTQYFRPPNPAPTDFDRDLSLIHRTGLHVVKAWVNWSTINPAPGRWDFSVYDRLFEASERQGVQVLVQLMTEAAPFWLGHALPEGRYVSADGSPLTLSTMDALQVGGYPGLCFHHPRVRGAVEEYIGRVGEHCRSRGAVAAYDAWNEIWLVECHCESTQARYREWLIAKYGSLDGLNNMYGGTSYTDIKQVRLPVARHPPPSLAPASDLMEFTSSVKAERLRWLRTSLRGADPTRPVVSHTVTTGLDANTDSWELAEEVDGWGVSNYAGDLAFGDKPKVDLPFYSPSQRLSQAQLLESALQFNVARDASRGKPWWLAEHSGGSVWTGYGHTQRDESTLKTVLAFSFGARAALYWQWRAERFGGEAPHFGLTGRAGEPTPRTAAAARLAAVVNEHEELLASLTWRPPEVGLIWQASTSRFEQITGDDLGGRNLAGYHAALSESGFDVQILRADDIGERGVEEHLRIIFAPSMLYDVPGLGENLAKWVQDGGTLVAGPLFQWFDSRRLLLPTSPSGPLRQVFGAQSASITYPTEGAIGGLPVERLLESLDVDAGTQTLERSDGAALLTKNVVGEGSAYLVGGFVGSKYTETRSSEFRRFLATLCTESGAARDQRAAEGFIVRTAVSQGKEVTFVFNLTETDRVVSISAPENVKTYQDLFFPRQTFPVSDGNLRVPLEASGCRILVCENLERR